MNFKKTKVKKSLSILLTVTLLLSMVLTMPITANAVEGCNLNYIFSGENTDTAGYAQGTITLSSDTDGDYYIYWANDTNALDGYYEITKLTITDNNSASFEFGNHTAIPANATNIIAVTDKSDLSVENAVAVYPIPKDKQLSSGSGKLLYKFNSYSDVHIDNHGFYVNGEKNWRKALKFAADKDTDFIVSSGDMVTNAAGPDDEWLAYEKALAESDYLNPVWESNGNHDLRSGVRSGLASFVRACGTDNTIANFDANKPYYYITEKKTGDIFIFMALENDFNPSSCDEFSHEQINWLSNLVEKYYGTGINIYIIEHSPIKGFGAGDRMENPYYKAHLSERYLSTVKFKRILQKYPKLIWMSGHTHEDYSMGYNYSNENGTACHMIHNPAVAGSTWAEPTATSLDYNYGKGYNSQGYYVETYENNVIYYGANITDELIYPQYCYIMDGSRGTTPDATNPTEEATVLPPEEETGVTGSTLPEGTETKRIYFANTLKWQFIDCYSWSETDQITCIWPGFGAQYYGTTEQGVDLYYCDIPVDHEKIIWNNAGNGYQTEDITLDGINDFFTPSSTISSKNVPVTASVWDYNPVTDPTDSTEQTTAPATEPTTEPEPAKYALCYYSNGTHGWSDIDTFFVKQSDGTYVLDFITKNSEGISCNVFNKETSKYNCVSASTALVFANGETNSYSLVSSSKRGKSLTISGLSEGVKIRFIYNPTDNSLTVICGDEVIPTTGTEPTETTVEPTTQPVTETTPIETTKPESAKYVLCYYSNGTHGWSDIDTFFVKQSDGTYVLDFITKNSEGISCNVFNKETSKYNCVSASTALVFANGETNSYSLVSSSKRGKSLTISGLSEGVKIRFIYNPTDNSLTVLCSDEVIPTTGTEPTENTVKPTTQPVTETTVPSTYEIGDVNTDGKIDVSDATAIQNFIINLITLNEEQQRLADVNFDNTITIKDATMVQKYAVKIISEFPANTDKNIEKEVSLLSSTEETKSITTLSEALNQAKTDLYEKYTFASYDQYQALKKLYYTYKDITSVDNEENVVAKFEELTEKLNIIAQHIGYPKIYPIGDVYYFENNYNWTTVNCYAWNGSTLYAVWPGREMQKVGTNNGHDVYGIKFESSAQYSSLIFNNGSEQTVDIPLNSFEFNCFALSGMNNGKYEVTNFNYNSEVEPTVAPTTTKPVDESSHYAMCYYSGSSHGWSNIDTFFTPMQDGTYELTFTANSTDAISLNVFDNSNSTYNCVDTSTGITFVPDTTNTYELVNSSKRGKSLTITGMVVGSTVKLIYKPTENIFTVIFDGVAETEPTENPSTEPTTLPSKDITYTIYMSPQKSSVESGNVFKANIKDSAGKYHSYTFENTNYTYDGNAVYKVDIVNPTYTDIIKIQFQTTDSADNFLGQVVDQRSVNISYYNNKIIVCSSLTSGTLKEFAPV